MSILSLRLPDSLHRIVRDVAAKDSDQPVHRHGSGREDVGVVD
jgi:hypothetical protein